MKRIQYFLLLVVFLGALSCSSSKTNFLGVQEPQKKSTAAPANPTLGRTQNAAQLAAQKEEDDKTPKVLKSYIEDQNYALAIQDIEKELSSNPDAADLNYFAGESYRKLGRPKEAIPYYEKAFEGNYDNEELSINYALVLKSTEAYEKAKSVLESYVQVSSVEIYKERAQQELKNLAKLDSISLNVRNVDLKGLSVNSENAEYSPYFFNNELYFASARETSMFERYDQPYSDIYKVSISKLEAESNSVTMLPASINSAEVNEGSIAFSPDGNTMVFAKGNPDDKRGRRSVDLFISTKKNDKWSNAVSMPINNANAWDSSPTFNQSGQTIYFASDRPGGFGGSDIYRATLNARGRWADVTNMGEDINTAGDEMFPYVAPDNKLYFASDGHAGFGLLDLFAAENKGGVVTISNLGPSFNSPADDFGLIYSDYPFEGFFTSNREGGLGSDDLYSFVDNSSDLKSITYALRGTTYQRNPDSTQAILGDVRVKLLDPNGEIVDDVLSSRAGTYSFPVEAEKEYTLIGERNGFFTVRKIFTTIGEGIPQEELVERFKEKVFNEDVTLDPIVLDASIVLDNIYYDLSSAEIRSDAAVELDKLVQLLLDNPEIKIELSSHTDARADDDFNQDLSQRRAQSAVDYIASKGISVSRLVAKGYGESQLINGCTNDRIAECSEEQHQQNRRTEFKVIEIED